MLGRHHTPLGLVRPRPLISKRFWNLAASYAPSATGAGPMRLSQDHGFQKRKRPGACAPPFPAGKETFLIRGERRFRPCT